MNFGDERSHTEVGPVLAVTGGHERCGAAVAAISESDILPPIETISVDEALDRAGDGAVDCVLCAAPFLERDVTELLREFDDRAADLPVVVLDGEDAIDPATAIDAGATDHVTLPLDPDRAPVLSRRVAEYCRRYRSERTATEFRSIFETLPDAVVVHDDDGNYYRANEEACELLGYSRDALLEKTVDEIEVASDREALEAFWRDCDPGESVTFEGRNRCADGTEFPVRVSLRRVDHDGPKFVVNVRDITELRERERELERSLDLLERTEQLAGAGGWELDPKSDELRWTEGTNHIFGVDTAYEPTLDDAIEFFHPDDRGRIETAIEEAIENGIGYDETVRVRTADGELRWVQARGDPHREDGETIRLRGTIRDVTDRKEREREIRAGNQKLRALSAAFPDVAFLLDEDGRYLEVFAGPESESLLAAPSEELGGKVIEEVLPDDPAREFVEAIDRALETGDVQTVEYQLSVPAGDRWFEARVAPLRERIEEEPAVAVVARDITEHRETTRTLRQREAHLEQAQAVANFGSWRKDIPGDEIEWSDEVYEIFGVSRDVEIVDHRRFMSHIHPDDEAFVERQWAAAKRGEPYDIEHRIITDDGETKWVRERAEIEFDDAGEPVQATGVVQDITDRKERERQLERQNDRLGVLNRVIRHDLRNQMNVISGYATTLEERTDHDDRSEMAARIQDAADELLSVSREVRRVNRLVDSIADRDRLQVSTLVDDACKLICEEYSEFDCECEIPDDLWVRGPEELHVALENVVENAVEHNDAACPRVSIEAHDRDDDGFVDLRIEDNGPGIPDSERELLTGDRDRTQLDHTSGIGLWVVRWIVSISGGELELDTSPGAGTAVTIRLPKASDSTGDA